MWQRMNSVSLTKHDKTVKHASLTPVTSTVFVKGFGNSIRKVDALVSECKIRNLIAVIL